MVDDLRQVDLTDLGTFSGGFPHGVFRLHRDTAPVWWHEPTAHTPDGEGFWSEAAYDDVLQVLSGSARDARDQWAMPFQDAQLPIPRPVHQPGVRPEDHGGPALRIPCTPRPDALVARVSGRGEGEPRPLHLRRQGLDGRTAAREHLHNGEVHGPEDEGQLEGVAGPQDPTESRGLPFECVDVRPRAACRVPRRAGDSASGRRRRCRRQPRCRWVRPAPNAPVEPIGTRRSPRRRRCRAPHWPPSAACRLRRVPSAPGCRARRASARRGWCRSTGRCRRRCRSATAARGCPGRKAPSTTGRNGSGIIPGSGRRRPISSVAATSSPAGIGSSDVRSHDATPRTAARRSADSSASSTEWTCMPPLCTMARRNSPVAAGVPSNVATLNPPADSPKIVTFDGSPPKAAMCSCTQRSAATWSWIPQLPTKPSGSARPRWPRKPRAPSR